jgi:hypothetical protein
MRPPWGNLYSAVFLSLRPHPSAMPCSFVLVRLQRMVITAFSHRFDEHGMPSAHAQFMGFYLVFRYGMLSC